MYDAYVHVWGWGGEACEMLRYSKSFLLLFFFIYLINPEHVYLIRALTTCTHNYIIPNLYLTW